MPPSDELDTVGRFDDRAEDYVRYRPTYPAEAVRVILDGLSPPAKLVAADVGAGTGISARLFGDQGVRVVAVEPGEVMRRAAAPHPHVTWVAARAEAIGLRSQSVDIVLCAQSFHWFRPEEVLPEFARILKRRGRLAIVWNRRRASDPFNAGYRQAIIEPGDAVAVESMNFDADIIPRSGVFSAVERSVFPNPQRLDLDGLIGRARSASYAPKSGAAGDQLLARLRALHAQYADASGFVTLAQDTEVYLSTRV